LNGIKTLTLSFLFKGVDAMSKPRLKVKRIDGADVNLPKYQTPGSAGFDLEANLATSQIVENAEIEEIRTFGKEEVEKRLIIYPGGRALIGTALRFIIPEGYELQVRPRSGLALKHGVTVLNSPGTVDSDYTDEVGVILINHGETPIIIEQGNRIAQGVLKPVEQAEIIEVDEIEETGRGAYGSTGV
jgi:dUTP pyrophosphatase